MVTLEPRIWKHTILQGSDEETLRDLRAAATRIKPTEPRGETAADGLLTEGDPWEAYDAACREADEFADGAIDRGVTVTLRAMGRKKYREIVKAHPPQDGNKDDVARGFNIETFAEALVAESIIGPTFSDGELERFLDELSPAQFDLLSAAALQLHNMLGANPKERLSSAPTPS